MRPEAYSVNWDLRERLSFENGKSNPPPIMDYKQGIIWISVLTVIYLAVISFIFWKRKEYPIYNRSPKLIIVGALSYFAIFLRGYRIYKVLSYYEDYWQIMKEFGEQSEQRISNFMSKEEAIRLEKSRQWRENNLLLFLFFNFIMPLLIFSLVSFAVPYVYTIVPVYQSDSCWQYFSDQSLILDLRNIPCGMKLTNSIFFVLFNWIEIVGFAVLYWMIRNIKNELNVKLEVQVVLIFWAVFSFMYFMLNFALQNLMIQADDYDEYHYQRRYKFIKIIILIAIQTRNVSTLFATTMFSIYTLLRQPEKAYPKTYESKFEALDFDLALSTSLPFQYFYDFVHYHSPFNKPYFDIYVLNKLYQEQLDELINEEKSEGRFKNEYEELEKQKEKIMKILNDHYVTHFNFGVLIQSQTPQFYSNHQSQSLSYSIHSNIDIKSFLPTFQFKPDNSTMQIDYVDFSLCVNKAKVQLKKCYETEFKKHRKFLELLSQLFKNEIEHKFLEQADFIKGEDGDE